MDVFTLAAKLTLDSKDFESGLEKSEGVFSSFGGKLASAAGTVATAVGVGLTAAAAGVGSLVKSAVEGYAQYEQLVGGVETLFGTGGKNLEDYAKSVGTPVDKAKKKFDQLKTAEKNVITNSKTAYKTAGLNMNQYMETVTAFSASLISSLGGDTVEAARIADMAITDMSDNANKMGTSMEAIQNAYQGFAKQNYTMLDNLKLGYGGTKTEMERLLADAEKLTNKKYDISNLNDVFEAIHAIQTELGITGTTAQEAEHTISGSIGMVKASWENLLIAFGDGNADLDYYIGNLVSSAEIAFDNLMPVIETALSGIATFVEKIAPVVADKLPDMVADVLPKLLNAAASILEGVINALPELIGALFTAIGNIDWLSLATSIWNAIKAGFAGLAGWFSGLFEDGKKAIGEIEWASVGTDLLGKIGNGLADIANWFKTKFEAASTGIAQIDWKQVGENVKTAIGNGLTAIKEWFQTTFLPGPDGIALVNWKGAGEAILGAIGTAFAAVIEFFQGLFSGVPAALTAEGGPDWVGAGTSILNLIGSAFSTIGDWMTALFAPAVTALTGEELTWSAAGSNILGLITEGIGDVVDWATKLFQSAADAILTVDWVGVGSKLRLLIETAVVGIINWFKTTFGLAKDEALKIEWAKLGESIVNLIQEGLKAIDGIFSGLFGQGWEDFKTTINELLPILVGVGAAATIAALGFAAVKTAMAFTDVITNFQTSISNLFSVILNHPFITIIAMIVGLVAALVTAYNTNEEFRNKVDAAWNAIKETAQTVWTTVSGAVELAFEVIQKAWDAVVGFFTDTIPGVWNDLSTKALSIWSQIKSFVTDPINNAKTILETAWNTIRAKAEEIWGDIKAKAEQAWNAVKGFIENPIATARDTLESIWNTIKTKAEELWKAIQDAVTPFIDGIKEAVDGFYTAVTNAVNKVLEFFGLKPEQTPNFTTDVQNGVTTPMNNADSAVQKVLSSLSGLQAYDGKHLATTTSEHIHTERTVYEFEGSSGTPHTGSEGKFAKGMFGGQILRGATIFGIDSNGGLLEGGAEGPEAVVGVNSLDQMIANSVQKGLSGIVAGIAGALNGGNQQPIYVVLDTGELVGAIGPKMDEELGSYGDWKGGGRA